MTKKYVFTVVALALATQLFPTYAASTGSNEDDLARGFLNPPANVRPAVYGFLMPCGPIPDDALARDLTELRAKGVTSVLMYFPGMGVARRDSKLIFGETENRVVPTKEFKGPGAISEVFPTGSEPWVSAEWRHSIRFAAKQAGRLGVDFGVCVGGAGCELGRVPIEFAQKLLIFSRTEIKTNGTVDMILPAPKIGVKKAITPQLYHDVVVLAVPANGIIPPGKVMDISSHMDVTGRLRWIAPEGQWSVLRFGYAISPGAGFIDHLSTEALDKKWELTMGKLLSEMTPEERQGLHYVECDSYEGGPETWTPKFAEEFKRLRGYDPLPWLPVLAGRVVGDQRQSDCFQRDYRLTISDLIAENHYAHHTELARASGLKFCSEAAGPHQHQADLLKSMSRCEVAMGEFWMPGTHRGVNDANRFLLRDAAAAAHGYGMKDVFCEAFTGGNDPWLVAPFQMKPCGDQAFCDGLTRPCIHGYSISPWLEDAPGVVYWAGTYFNRLVTWWDKSPPFLDYLSRCSFLLSQGLFVADVAYFTADGIDKPISRKAAYPDLAGRYDYDHINSDILLTRMSVKDGRLMLPDGMNYRLLVLATNEALPVAVLRKLLNLVQAGATVLGTRPPGPYGLADDPAEFASLVDQLWGADSKSASGTRRIGKGRVVWGKPVLQLLAENDVHPDFECAGVSPKGVIDWIHRQTDAGDFYFVCSRWQPVEQVECKFRVSGRVPELWDPLTGTFREASAFRQENGGIVVPLRFDPCGSVFVLFRKPTQEISRAGKNWREFQPVQPIAGPWTIAFEPQWFYPNPTDVTNATVVFDQLEDWSKRPEDAIKYYSGKATYRTTFTLPAQALNASNQKIFMDLGAVKELAEIRLNGKNLGVLWTKPYRLDISAALKPGTNNLQVDVINLWPNRLIGDTFLPKAQRRTRTNMTKYTQASDLLPSGLLGPVTLQNEK